jgi:hypothetical protein
MLAINSVFLKIDEALLQRGMRIKYGRRQLTVTRESLSSLSLFASFFLLSFDPTGSNWWEISSLLAVISPI